MAEIKYPEQYSWWLNELESLGVNTLEKHGLNNHKEASDLTEAVSRHFMKIIFYPIVKNNPAVAVGLKP
jgi:hypothetical protein